MSHDLTHDHKAAKQCATGLAIDGQANPHYRNLARAYLALRKTHQECGDALGDSMREVAALREDKVRLMALIGELTDTGDCHYDHHGYCQSHKLDPKPCPHERARALLDAAYAAQGGTDG